MFRNEYIYRAGSLARVARLTAIALLFERNFSISCNVKIKI